MWEVCLRYLAIERLVARIDDHTTGQRTFSDPFAEVEALVQTLDLVEKGLAAYVRGREADTPRYRQVGIAFDWRAMQSCKERTVELAQACCRCAIVEYAAFEAAYGALEGEAGGEGPKSQRKASVLFNRAYNFLQKAFQFAFRVYRYTGGFDAPTEAIFEQVHQNLQTMAQIKEQRQAAAKPPPAGQQEAAASPGQQGLGGTEEQAQAGAASCLQVADAEMGIAKQGPPGLEVPEPRAVAEALELSLAEATAAVAPCLD